MTKSATKEGTTRYAQRFTGRASVGHSRESQRLVLSSIGIGTYLGQPDTKTDEGYAAAIVAAVENGINVIDAAINYRFQRSERSIGTAIPQLAAKGFEREEIILCTKGGYLTPDDSMPADSNEYFFREYIQPGIFSAKDIAAGSHCMTPKFLKNQLGRRLKNLGVECIDVYYLHNPETQLAEVSKEEFLNRVREAFTFLESAVEAGEIQYYGLATWNGFRQDARARPDGDGSGKRTGRHADCQCFAVARKSAEESAGICCRGAGAAERRGACAAVCALVAGNYHGAGGHVAHGTREGERSFSGPSAGHRR